MSMSDDEMKQYNEHLAESNRMKAEELRMQAAQLDLLTKMAQAQGINISSLNKNKTAYDSLYGSTTKQSAAAQANAYATEQMQKAQENLNKAIVSGTASTVAFGKAMLSGEQGFAKYNQALGSAGDAALSLGKNFGLVGLALGGLIKGATMVAEAATKQADNTLKATDDLSKMGSAGAFSAKEVLKMGHDAGLTSKNLELFTKATKSLGTATLSLGTTAGEGIAEFAKMTAVSAEQRKAFQRLGISQEELIQSQADFVSLQKASGVQITARMKQDNGLQKASLEYTKNLLELAAITGEDVEGAKKLQLEAQSELETKIQTNMMQQRINELYKQGGADAEAQAKALEAELKARNDVLAVVASTKDAELKAATAQFLATGAITEQSVMLKRLIPNIEEFGAKIKKGENVSTQFAEALVKGVDANVKQVGTAGQLDKSVAKIFGMTDGLLTWSAQRRDVDLKAAKDAAGKIIGDPNKEKPTTGDKTEKDPAQIARGELTELERKAAIELDKFILKFNPLLNGFDDSTKAATALAAAAGIAAVALTTMAGLSALKGLKDMVGKGGAGAVSDVAKTASNAGGAMKALGTAGKVLGKVAVPLAVASAGYDAYKGYSNPEKNLGIEGRKATTGEKLSSAAGGALSGLTFGLISSETISKGIAKVTGAGPDAKSKTTGTTENPATVKPTDNTKSSPAVSIADIEANMAKGMSQKDAQKAAEEKLAKMPATALSQEEMMKMKATSGTPALKNSELESSASIAKGMADMVKQDQERAKQAKEDALKLTTASNTQEVSITTLNRTLLATNNALKDLTKSITDATNPTAGKGTTSTQAGQLPQSDKSTAGRGISVPNGISATFKSASGTSIGGAAGGAMPSDSKKTTKPTSQAPEGSENGTDSASKSVDLTKIMKFGTGSGAQENFEGLNSTFKDAVTAAATEYNAVTGNKLKINSAKRNSEDQQRLWDETVAAGTPGKGPTGMAVGKPGRSLHERGEAVDIQNYKDPEAVAAMNKQGLSQKVPGDPVHFQALEGGILDGPKSGYPVEGIMHGREAIIPLNPDSIITKLLETPESKATKEINNDNTISTNTSSKDDITNQIMTDLYAMMEEKFDAMIDALEDGNDHTEKLVKFSAV